MRLFFRTLFVCGSLLAGVIFTGCRSSSQDPIFSDNPGAPATIGSPPSVTTEPSDAYAPLFRVGETVTVTFSGIPDAELIQPHEEPIKEDGTITLPYIGPVTAAGKTPGELQKDILNLYVPQYYVRLTVTVKSEDRVYYVGGQVVKPGPQVYLGETTVVKAIQSAGDFNDFASHKVWLTRANGQRIKVNCDKALKDPTLDPAVYPGDQIQVSRRLW